MPSAFDNDEMNVTQLQITIERLSRRCAALESQTILVAVQQLDILARALAWSLTIGLFLIYCATSYLLITLLPAWLYLPSTKLFYGLSCIVASIPILYNYMTHGSLHRRMEVFVIAAIVIIRTKLCRWRERTFASAYTDDKFISTREEDIWDANYEVSARFLYVSIHRLRGLWTKTAQYLSSRADVCPPAYIRELRKLQDEAPATPWEQIHLPHSVSQYLTDVDPHPLASASIGQVHRANWKGEAVVVKVQHPVARPLLLDDFLSLRILLRVIAWIEPEYEFLCILMREWITEARKELDFTIEANHLLLANRAIAAFASPDVPCLARDEDGNLIPFQVEIPRPIEWTATCLIMSFCEGVRVDDFVKLQQWGLSRHAVVDGVAQAFAFMMYCTDIFNGDPHPGNILLRPSSDQGFTLVLLDWGLAKQLTDDKRLAFCQMVYAASTFDYGLLLDSYKTIGLRLKQEDASGSMEDIRFFLRDMAPSEKARKRIKAKIKADQEKFKEVKVPMESKTYPGAFFFFIRVNELLHGLGSRFGVTLTFLDTLRPYAERGLRTSKYYNEALPGCSQNTANVDVLDLALQAKLEAVFTELQSESQVIGGQMCVLDKEGRVVANIASGTLGGLKSHLPMQRSALVLGFSCTKAVTTTLAHVMVQQGYLSYDECLSERVWTAFCPSRTPPESLAAALQLPHDDVKQRWQWKSQITLGHVLKHQAGLCAALPTKLTIKGLASCEDCAAAFEYNPNFPQNTLLPDKEPGTQTEYHFMSFGWLVAGALCGAYALKHELDHVTYDKVYQAILVPKLSNETLRLGFRPNGGSGGFMLAQTCTADISTTKLLQMQREARTLGEESDSAAINASTSLRSFEGKEFLLDPRIWNSIDAIDACVPAAGGRFSAAALAHFYHDLFSGRLLDRTVLELVTSPSNVNTLSNSSSSSLPSASLNTTNGLMGVTQLSRSSADDDNRTSLGFGYSLLRFDRDDENPSGLGHAGVGGSIGFFHKPSGISVGLMLNKADGGISVTMRILRILTEHFDI